MGRADADSEQLRITVVRSLAPRQLEVLSLVMPSGATIADAVQRCGWWSDSLLGPDICYGVWGKLQPPGHVLRDLDRVEIYRGLRVDPKQARRERYAAHKAKHSVVKRRDSGRTLG